MPNFYDSFVGNLGDPPGNLPGGRQGIAETYPRLLATSIVTPLSTNWVASATYLPAGLKISGITFFSGSAALNTATHQWFGIWSSSLALLRGSADDTSTAWGTHTAKRLALTSSFTTTYSGLYYVGLEITASVTVPNIIGIGPGGSGSVRVLTPPFMIQDTTTADTALAPTLVNAAAASGGCIAPYGVLD